MKITQAGRKAVRKDAFAYALEEFTIKLKESDQPEELDKAQIVMAIAWVLVGGDFDPDNRPEITREQGAELLKIVDENADEINEIAAWCLGRLAARDSRGVA